MKKVNLNDLRDWIIDEKQTGNRIKASKIYKIFCKYVVKKFPDVSEHDMRYFFFRDWYY